MEGVEGFAQHLLSRQHPVWKEHVVLADVNGRLVLLKGGQLLSTWDLADPSTQAALPLPGAQKGAANPLPQLTLVSPAAVFLGPEGQDVMVTGQGIACGDCKITCRAAGAYHDVECRPFGNCCQPGEDHSAQVSQILEPILLHMYHLEQSLGQSAQYSLSLYHCLQ